MKRIITLLTLLSIVGCQTVKRECPVDLQTDKVSVILELRDQHGLRVDSWEDKITLTAIVQIYIGNDMIAAPTITLKPNEWRSMEVGDDIKGVEQTARILIGNEVVELNCEPGTRMILKATPIENGMVELKGAYALCRAKETNLLKQKKIFPFTVHCKTGEKTTIFEVKTELEPVN